MRTDARTVTPFIAAAAAVTAAVLLLVPFDPSFSPTESTAGWPTRVAGDLAEGRRFGVENAFSYGPFGLIPIRAYYPGTYFVLLAGSLAIAAAFVASGMRLGRRCGLSSPASAVVTLLAAAIVTSQLYRVGTEPIFNVLVAFVALLAMVRQGSECRWCDALLGCALALSGLGKFNYFVAALGAIAIVSVGELRARRAPVTAIAFAGSIPLAWLAAGQSPADFARFVLVSLELLRGYTEAMSLESQSRDAVSIVVAAALVAALVPLMSRARSRAPDELAIRVCWAFWVFVVMKSAVVRQDEHVLSAALSLLAAGVFLALVSARDGSLPRMASLLATALAAIGALIALASFGASPAEELLRPVQIARAQATALGRSAVDRGWLERRHRANLAVARAANPMPGIEGSIDFLPASSNLPLAHGLLLAPNPIVMSYVGPCAPRLAEMQAEHLRRGNAPRNLVAGLETIDERYPTLDLGPALLEILTHYDSSGSVGGELLLSRRNAARRIVLERIAMRDVRPGESIDLAPTDGLPVWARVTVKGTAVRGLASAIYRAPLYTIRATLESGRVVRHRFVPAGGSVGFLLSPYVSESAELRSLVEGREAEGRGVSSLAIDVGPTPLPVVRSVAVELFIVRELR